MDTDNSGGLDSTEFCTAMKKLVLLEDNATQQKDDCLKPVETWMIVDHKAGL